MEYEFLFKFCKNNFEISSWVLGLNLKVLKNPLVASVVFCIQVLIRVNIILLELCYNSSTFWLLSTLSEKSRLNSYKKVNRFLRMIYI